MLETTRDLLTMEEAAALLSIEVRTLRRWVKEKDDLPFAKIGRLIRFRRVALLAWVEQQEQATMAAKRAGAADHDFLQQLRVQFRDAVGLRHWLSADLESRSPEEMVKKLHLGSAWAATEQSLPEEYRDDMRQLLRMMHQHDVSALDFARQVFAEVHRQDGDEGSAAGAEGQ